MSIFDKQSVTESVSVDFCEQGKLSDLVSSLTNLLKEGHEDYSIGSPCGVYFAAVKRSKENDKEFRDRVEVHYKKKNQFSKFN